MLLGLFVTCPGLQTKQTGVPIWRQNVMKKQESKLSLRPYRLTADYVEISDCC